MDHRKSDATTWDQAAAAEMLRQAESARAALAAHPGIGRRSFGLPELDAPLYRAAGLWLSAHGEMAPTTTPQPASAPDVFLATKLYPDGGHTALIGDLTAALSSIHPGAPPPFLLLSQIQDSEKPPPPEVIERTGIRPQNIRIIATSCPAQRMAGLLRTLRALRPRRLFLLHHPEDSAAAACARNEVVPECYLLHHADAVPSLGVFLPDIRLIDLHPHAAALSRNQGLRPALLPLTCPDPGPPGIPPSAPFATAVCGSHHKFDDALFLSYADTVPLILENIDSEHIHIGHLPKAKLATIRDRIAARGQDPDRFRHVRLVPSLRAALHELGASVLMESWPICGARVRIEGAAAGLPLLRHVSPGSAFVGESATGHGIATWRTHAQLADLLQDLRRTPAALVTLGRERRAIFERDHSPKKFCEHLANILQGGDGADNPDAAHFDNIVKNSMHRALTRAMLAFSPLESTPTPAPPSTPTLWQRLTGTLRKS